MKLKSIFMIAFALFGINTWAQQATNPILGKWTDEKGERMFEIVQNANGSYDAIIRKAENRDVIGKKQITSLKASNNKTYQNGTIHLFSRGKTGKCSAKLLDAKTLEVTGKVGVFSKTAIWKKIQ